MANIKFQMTKDTKAEKFVNLDFGIACLPQAGILATLGVLL